MNRLTRDQRRFVRKQMADVPRGERGQVAIQLARMFGVSDFTIKYHARKEISNEPMVVETPEPDATPEEVKKILGNLRAHGVNIKVGQRVVGHDRFENAIFGEVDRITTRSVHVRDPDGFVHCISIRALTHRKCRGNESHGARLLPARVGVR